MPTLDYKGLVDAPLYEPGTDALKRKGFARLLADAVAHPNPDGATTFALCGRWGSGKTTIANFVDFYLRDRARVIRFEPWMVGTPEALVRELFIEISRQIFGKGDAKEDNTKRERYWKYASSVLDVVKTSGKALGAAGVPIVGLIAEGADSASKMAKSMAEGLDQMAHQEPLREARESIKAMLREIADPLNPIVMVVDDVDRLDDDEIRTLFRMVKACADFPNVRYLLLFDKRQVARALAPKGSGRDGVEFVEKIVNVSFDLPVPTEADRKAVLCGSLEHILALAVSEDEIQRRDELIDKVLAPSLPHLRAVKRYAAAATALGLGMIDSSGPNFDVADFLSLEFLRSEHPVVYEVMLAYEFDAVKAYLKKYDKDAPTQSPWLQRLDAALAETGESEEVVRSVVKSLRPDVDFVTGTTNALRQLPQNRGKRFYDPAWQPVYVGFDPERAALTEEAWNRLVVLLDGDHTVVRLPRKFTRGPNSGLVGQRSSNATWLAARILDEIWARGKDAVDVLDRIATQTGTSVMRTVLLDQTYSTAKRRSVSFWTSRERLEERVRDIGSKVEALVDSKRIWEVKGARQLLSLWFETLGDRATQEWYDAMYDDPELLRSFLEHELEEPRDENAVTSGPVLSKNALKVAAFNPDGLGPRGKQIQAEYRRLIDQYRTRRARLERMR